MGHPQSLTNMKTDNITDNGFEYINIKEDKSKSIDMQFRWLKSREAELEFFRNSMQMRIVNGTQKQIIDDLPTTPQLLHQYQQQTSPEMQCAAKTEQNPSN